MGDIVCAGEYVGPEEIDDGIWNVYFGMLKLGRLYERQMRIADEYCRLKRHRVQPMSSDFFVTHLPGRFLFSWQTQARQLTIVQAREEQKGGD